MKKLLQLHLSKLLLLVMMVTGVTSWGQANENFQNIPSNASSYANRSWTGTNNVTWTATNARTDQTLNGRAIATNNVGSVTSPTYSGGMGTLTFSYVRAFTGEGQRSIEVFVNGNKIGNTISVNNTSNDIQTYSSQVNITGDVVLQLRTSGAQIKIDDIAWTAVPTASLTVTPTSLTGFSYVQGSGPSAAQTFQVSGSSFTSAMGNITITAPAGYEVSTAASTTFTNSKTIPYTGSALATTTVSVRLKAGLNAGNYNQAVTISGGGAANTTVTVNGNVTALPSLTATPAALTGFSYAQGIGPSDVQSFSVTGSSLTGAPGVITVAGTTAYEVSLTASSGFADEVTFPYSAATLPARTIYVRLKSGLQQGAYNEQEIIVEGGGDIIAVTVSGTVTAPPTSLFTNVSQLNFGPIVTGVASVSQQFTITGESLETSSNVIISVSGDGYLVSVDNVTFNTFVVIPVTSSTLSQIVYVRFTPPSYGTKTGVISVIGNGPNNVIVTQQVNVTGLGLLNAPVAYAASDVLDTAFVANWDAVAGANEYLLDVSTTSDFSTFVQGYNSLPVTGTAKLVTGLTPGTTYYYRVRAARTELPEVTSANSNTIIVGTRNVLTWTGTQWLPEGYPTINDVVRIEGDYNTAENNTGNTTPDNLRAFSINVVSGSFTVATGTSVEIQAGLTVEPTAFVTVQNNGVLIQNEPNAVNTGNVTVLRNSSELFRSDYTMWSSPVAGQNLLDFSPYTSLHRFYEYDTANNYYVSNVDGALDPTDDDFETGIGYLIRMPNSLPLIPGYNEGTESIEFDGEFEGQLHNGNIQVNLSVAGNGFNAVGNPYPSPIDADQFLTDNAVTNSTIGGTLYFWRKKNGVEGDFYATYTLAGGTGTDVGSSTDGTLITNLPNGIIQTGQGFIVQALAGGQAALFNNEQRIPDFQNQFFRSGNNVVLEKHRMWFNFTSPEGLRYQSMVAYMEGATNGFDNAIDGKRFSTANDGFYSVIDNGQYAIQGRALPFTAQDEVPMAYKAKTAGSYSITLAETDGLFAQGQDIFIKDNVTGTLHNIKAGTYTFVTEAGTFNDRFTIVYTDAPAMGTTDNTFTANNVVVYKQGTTLTINTGKVSMTDVTIYDIQGRAVYTKNGINASEAVITNLQSQQEVLIVQITTPQGKVSKKVVF